MMAEPLPSPPNMASLESARRSLQRIESDLDVLRTRRSSFERAARGEVPQLGEARKRLAALLLDGSPGEIDAARWKVIELERGPDEAKLVLSLLDQRLEQLEVDHGRQLEVVAHLERTAASSEPPEIRGARQIADWLRTCTTGAGGDTFVTRGQLTGQLEDDAKTTEGAIETLVLHGWLKAEGIDRWRVFLPRV